MKSGRGSGLSIEPADWRLHPAQAPSTTEDDGIPPYFPEGSARPAKTLQAPGGLKRLIQVTANKKLLQAAVGRPYCTCEALAALISALQPCPESTALPLVAALQTQR